MDGAAEVMAGALAAHLGNRKRRLAFGEDPLFFRIHDSGDFTFSPNTYLLWKLVAEDPRMSAVSFWAPTRMWVFPQFRRIVSENPPPENMSLRPSALHFNDLAPGIDGFHAGSTAHTKGTDPVRDGIAQWVCPAYQHDGKSCAGGGGPQREKDCRACWSYKDTEVSYLVH